MSSQEKEGKQAWKDQLERDGRSMRAVETIPAALLGAGEELSEALARRGQSRIDHAAL